MSLRTFSLGSLKVEMTVRSLGVRFKTTANLEDQECSPELQDRYMQLLDGNRKCVTVMGTMKTRILSKVWKFGCLTFV